MKLTKQGVRDLNPPGFNGRRSRGTRDQRCCHLWVGLEVIGWRSSLYDWEAEPIYGQKCMACGAVRR